MNRPGTVTNTITRNLTKFLLGFIKLQTRQSLGRGINLLFAFIFFFIHVCCALPGYRNAAIKLPALMFKLEHNHMLKLFTYTFIYICNTPAISATTTISRG